MKKLAFCLRIATYVVFVALVAGYFFKGRLTDLPAVSDASLNPPVQTKSSEEPIVFTDNGYKYNSTPLFEYKLTGIVVHKMGYSLFEQDGPDKTAPYDLCIVWGDNVKNKTYLSGDIKFSQDMRWCSYRYKKDVGFKTDQLSNNHLLIKDSDVFKKEKSINVGDEVEITGYLVNVRAEKVNDPGENLTWNSSTSREDTGAGACEVILTKDIQVLHRAHPFSSLAFTVGLYLLPALILTRIALFFLRR